MEGKEGAETGETWWDADKEKFAITEGDEEPLYYDLLPNGYGSTYEMDGLPELDIMENVTCEERETFVDDNTTVKTGIAENTTGVVVAKWEGMFTRIKDAPVEEYETINIAVDKLDEASVTKIIAVPLFISSHSGHIGEIEYVLGLREELPTMSMMSGRVFVEGKELERAIVSLEGRYRVIYMPVARTVSAVEVTAKQHHGGGEAEEEELVPVDTPAEIVLTNAIDDLWAIADLLVDHAAALSEDPANETIVLVANGTDNESDLLVRAVVQNVSTTSHPIVVPLMVSEGYFTGIKIPGLLQNLSYAYPEEGERALTPHRGDVKINSRHPSD
jgi:hypothetical protein